MRHGIVFVSVLIFVDNSPNSIFRSNSLSCPSNKSKNIENLDGRIFLKTSNQQQSVGPPTSREEEMPEAKNRSRHRQKLN